MNVNFGLLDWCVLVIYALAMMGIGWWYSCAGDIEEYMLGGREMKPWAVGISLFATLMSTLSYLAFPGEMIQHGPMILATVLAYPFVYLVVGWCMIPFITKLKVSSAYEILERRFGLSVRLLGSALFLVLRLLWMALIVYATSDSVLVPLLGLGREATPWVSLVLSVLTIAYTSMGGLQAVVVTDVVQTFIMLIGAMLSLAIITFHLGGVAEWWPTSWSPYWDKPSFFFATQSRVPAGTAILATFVWYVATAGSDQMAIQRYLSTRDAESARKMFGISLICNAVVNLLLAALGLALFAYFSVHTEILSSPASVSQNADRLLPTFIVEVLPTGISGLVIAGILSAAMDSLSSGINSSCSVVTEDWIDRFRHKRLEARGQIVQARLVSWLLGAVVILVSLAANYVTGNLLEVSYKLVNLLTAPLFVLFFMAMFVPWATAPGAWAAALFSTTTAVLIAFVPEMGFGFLWIMPISLAIGIVTGCVFSLIPMGVKRPMLEFSDVN